MFPAPVDQILLDDVIEASGGGGDAMLCAELQLIAQPLRFPDGDPLVGRLQRTVEVFVRPDADPGVVSATALEHEDLAIMDAGWIFDHLCLANA